jgi:hypothetical protein
MTESEAPSQIPIGYASLQGSPIQLTPMQEFMQPHLGGLEFFWWGVWIAVLVFLVARFIMLPLFKKFAGKK